MPLAIATAATEHRVSCLDNAVLESSFGTLKSEYFHVNKFSSLDELEAGLRGYIRYYSRDRTRCVLNGMRPVEYRQLVTVDWPLAAASVSAALPEEPA